MTKEDKELLLKDLSARLLYGVIMTNKKLKDTYYPLDGNEWQQAYYDDDWDDVPYLRPMSSMTEEEKKYVYRNFSPTGQELFSLPYVDWLNEHHFDYRGLIEKGLALEATTEMYNK